MSFLTPLFLLGGLAIAGPVLFHLIRRNTKERFTFGSLMFLRPDPLMVTRKSRLEDLLLLLLRCALLALLALGFARPFFRETVALGNESGSGSRLVLLVDSSASMRRAGLWEQVRERAEEALAETKPTDTVSILAFADETRTLLTFKGWSGTPERERKAHAEQILADIEPGWGGTGLGDALAAAVDILEESGSGTPARIVVLTDGQEGSRLNGLQGREWPENLSVEWETIDPKAGGNVGLELAPERKEKAVGDTDLERVRANLGPRVRVTNSPDSENEQFRLTWLGPDDVNVTPPVHLYLPAGRAKVIRAPVRPAGSAALRLGLLGDDEPFDNHLHFLAEIPEPIRIHYVGADRAKDEESMRYYLERAFSNTRHRRISLHFHAPSALAGKLNRPDDRLLVVAENLPEDALRDARAFCESGRPVLLVLKNESLGATLSALTESGPVPVKEAAVDEYLLLNRPDFEHPLFAPFNQPRFADFTKIHFWKRRMVEADRLLGVRVAARFDDDSPAVLDLPLGRGRLVVLTSGWNPADSQLALSSKFVPLLYSLMDLGRTSQPLRTLYKVGEFVALPGGTDEAHELKGPMGIVSVPAGEDSFRPDIPGIYELSGERKASFTVNLTPAESRTAPLPEETLAGLGLPLDEEAAEGEADGSERRQALLDVELENRQQNWRLLIAAAVVLAIIETWLGGRAWRGPVPAAETRKAV